MFHTIYLSCINVLVGHKGRKAMKSTGQAIDLIVTICHLYDNDAVTERKRNVFSTKTARVDQKTLWCVWE